MKVTSNDWYGHWGFNMILHSEHVFASLNSVLCKGQSVQFKIRSLCAAKIWLLCLQSFLNSLIIPRRRFRRALCELKSMRHKALVMISRCVWMVNNKWQVAFCITVLYLFDYIICSFFPSFRIFCKISEKKIFFSF